MGLPKEQVSVVVSETTPLLVAPSGTNATGDEAERGVSSTQSNTDSGVPNPDEHVSAVVIWLIFPILLAGVFLSNVASSVVIATNQQIASDFEALSSAAWLLTIYTLSQSTAQPLVRILDVTLAQMMC